MEQPIYTGLAGMTAFVTGGASGIGRATALEFARQRVNVMILDVDRKGLMEMGRLSHEGGEIIWKAGSVVSEKDIEAAFGACKAKWGNIDIIVNNAGIAPKESYALADTPEDVYDRVIGVNMKGYFLVTKHAARALREQAQQRDSKYPDGSIIYICSNAGLLGSAMNIYGISNAGRLGIFRQAALELPKYGVRVNVVIPGDVLEGSGIWSGEYLQQRAQARGMNTAEAAEFYKHRAPLGQEATAQQVADIVAALACPNGPFRNTSGKILSADGGQITM